MEEIPSWDVMKLFLDCEFTNFNGQLMSMGLVDENDVEFYQVIKWTDTPHEWVVENVIPILLKDPISHEDFQTALYRYLSKYDSIHVIADWPEDIKYFCQSLISGPGRMMNIQSSFTMEVTRRLKSYSALEHNALEDARGIKRAYMIKNTI